MNLLLKKLLYMNIEPKITKNKINKVLDLMSSAGSVLNVTTRYKPARNDETRINFLHDSNFCGLRSLNIKIYKYPNNTFSSLELNKIKIVKKRISTSGSLFLNL